VIIVALRLLIMSFSLHLLVLTLCAATIQYTSQNTSPTHTTELAQLRAVLLAADYTVHGVATVLGLGAAAAAGVGIALQNVSVPAVAASIATALPSEVSTNLYTVLMLVLVYSFMHSVLAGLDSALVASTSCTSKIINLYLHCMCCSTTVYCFDCTICTCSIAPSCSITAATAVILYWKHYYL
jgi:hypothetical protein